jgi:hypothetical protein
VLVAVLLGFLAEFLYAFAARPWLATFSASLLFSLAALVAGGLFGFLFGLPYAGGSSSSGSRAPFGRAARAAGMSGATTVEVSPGSDVTASTNLQQIADWLTKLILGAGLTQLGHLPHASSVLFHAMAGAIGGSASAEAVAGGIAIYFAILGFVTGWLATYFFLTPAMSRLDRRVGALVEQSILLEGRAARADSNGQKDRADRLRAASHGQAAKAESLVANYANIYARPRSDPYRIRDLDQVIAEASREALNTSPTPDEVKAKYDAGTQRQKEVALAMMADDPSKVNVDALMASIASSHTAMEQYQALRAASVLTDELPADQVSRLRAVVETEVQSGEHFSRASARYQLAAEVLAKLEAGK